MRCFPAVAMWLASLLACLVPLQGLALENRMAGEHSPYLTLHEDDPVAWQPWDADALALARDTDRLLFVSIGYYACYWCHVMQRESFQDEAVAEVLNEFVPVKVDRELNPALDRRLLEFVRETRGAAGWPLNVIMTPEGYPLLGFVYLPPDRLRSVTVNTLEQWDDEADSLRETARRAEQELAAQRREGIEPVELTADRAQSFQEALMRDVMAEGDDLSGGFGQEIKFPHPDRMLALLELVARDDANPALRDFVELTLDAMAGRALRDHLGGGFFRYVEDPGWDDPHFEKMLYDNGALAAVYQEAAAVLDRPEYAEIARETVDFMERELADDGAFAASLMAEDAQAVEGGWYLWPKGHLESLLEPELFQAAMLHWGLDRSAGFDHGHLPVATRTPDEVAGVLEIEPAEAESRIEAARQILLAERADRELGRDEKRLTAWNALALLGVTRVAEEDETYRERAAALRDFLADRFDGTRIVRDAGVPGTLEDYGYSVWALAEYARMTGDETDRELAVAVARAGWARLFDPEAGFRETEQDLLPIDGAEMAIPDGHTPSPSAKLIRGTILLLDQGMTAEELPDKITRALELGLGAARNAPLRHASYLTPARWWLEQEVGAE